MLIYWILVIGWFVGAMGQLDGASTRSMRLNRTDECVEDVLSGTEMRAPYFLVPIEPDTDEKLHELVRFDLDTGRVCALGKPFERVKFTALSINQGLALNLEITLVDYTRPRCINRTHSLSPSGPTQIGLDCRTTHPINNATTKIDEHLFYFEQQAEGLIQPETLRIELVDKNQANIKLKCPRDTNEYVYEIKLVHAEYEMRKSPIYPNVIAVVGRVVEEKTSSSRAPIVLQQPSRMIARPSPTTAAAQITKNVGTLAKFTLNLKLFAVTAASLSALLVVLVYVAFVALRRLLFATAAATTTAMMSSHDSNSHQEMDTIRTRMSDVFFTSTTTTTQSSDPTGLFSHSNQYLSRLGVDMVGNLRHLFTTTTTPPHPQPTSDLYVSCQNTMTNFGCDNRFVPMEKWYRLLNWRLDFNSMSDVFDDLAKFKS